MARRLLVEGSPGETRLALIEEDILAECRILRDAHADPGSIHLARVISLERRFDGLFLDLGRGPSAFLPLAEVKGQRLSPGAPLIVAVVRGERDGKGPRVTLGLGFPGRWLVLRYHSGIGQAKDPAFAAALTQLMPFVPEGASLEPRRGWEKAPPGALEAEAKSLAGRAAAIFRAKAGATAPCFLGRGIDPLAGAILDFATDGLDAIVIDERYLARRLQDHLPASARELLDRIDYATARSPLFEAEGFDEAIETLIDRRVSLPGGGSLLIEPTSACIAIDVDSGETHRRGGEGEIALSTNLEAVKAIARRLRLLNLSGRIVIDFIGSGKSRVGRRGRAEVLARLAEALARDPIETRILRAPASFGLVELFRERSGLSLIDQLSESSQPLAGRRLTVPTVAFAALRRVDRMARHALRPAFEIRLSSEVANYLVAGEGKAARGRLEERLGRELRILDMEGWAREHMSIEEV